MDMVSIETQLAVLSDEQQREYTLQKTIAKEHWKQGADHIDKFRAAISIIKRKELYRGEYRSFSAFCAGELEAARNTWYEWIRNDDINLELSPHGYKPLTVSETEVLKRYTPEQRQVILAVAYGSVGVDGRINAPIVQAAADAVTKIAHSPIANRLKADTLNEAAIAHDATVSEKRINSQHYGQYYNELITTVEQVIDKLPDKLRGLKESAKVKIVIYTESE